MKHWILFALIACGTPESAPEAPPAPAVAKTPEAPPEAPAQRVGLVKEVMHAERYTYALMDACGSEAWVAGPNMQVAVGETVLMSGGAPMTNFHSKALDRNFEAILFVDGWKKGDKPLICDEKKPAVAPAAVPDAPQASLRTGIVLETMESGGYTYALLDVCGNHEWVAGPTAPVKVGQTVATPKGSAMPGFTSKTLGRTFESIFFVTKYMPPAGPLDCG